MRVGGPYTIIVELDKFQSRVIENVYLDLNDTLQLNAQLQPVSDVERITVTGTRDFFSNSGANSVFGEDAIQNMPTFDRDLKDIVRSNPLAVVSPDVSELGVAGTNPIGSDTRNYDEFDVSESTWRIKVGVKYTF